MTHSGVCLCCGVMQTGERTVSRPEPYWASEDPFGGGKRIKVVLIKSERGGAHEVPYR